MDFYIYGFLSGMKNETRKAFSYKHIAEMKNYEILLEEECGCHLTFVF